MPLQSDPSSAVTRARISSAALFVKVTASTSSGLACPSPMRYAARLVMTRVFPEPAPARIRSGPLMCRTASRCSGFSVLRNSIGRPRAGADLRVRARRRADTQVGPYGLFYRDRLREIPRLIDVAASTHGDVVREELKRYDHHDRRQQFGGMRDFDHEIALRVEHRLELVVSA